MVESTATTSDDFLMTNATRITKNRLDKRYTILSLDGGGVRGLMTSQIIARIEETIDKKLKAADPKAWPGYKLSDSLDCVIGTSVGGLIALAIGCGFDCKELAVEMESLCATLFDGALSFSDLYNDKEKTLAEKLRTTLVNNTKLKEAIEDKLIGKLKYLTEQKAKAEGREVVFDVKKATLKDIRALNPNLRVVVTFLRDVSTASYSEFRPDVFDTEDPTDDDVLILDAALATAAAPVYFDPVEQKVDGENNKLIDGGTYANNPAGLGFALTAVNIKAENIKLISVGTGEVDKSYKPPADPKKKKDEKKKQKGLVNRMFDSVKKSVANTLYKWTFKDMVDNMVKEQAEAREDRKGALAYMDPGSASALFFDVQRSAEQMLEIYAKHMEDFYWRFNPKLDAPINLASGDPETIAAMNKAVKKYFRDLPGGKPNEVLEQIDYLSTLIITLDDYNHKAFHSMEKAIFQLRYAQELNQDLERKQANELGILAKILLERLEQQGVRLALISDQKVEDYKKAMIEERKHLRDHFKTDDEYPHIKGSKTTHND